MQSFIVYEILAKARNYKADFSENFLVVKPQSRNAALGENPVAFLVVFSSMCCSVYFDSECRRVAVKVCDGAVNNLLTAKIDP